MSGLLARIPLEQITREAREIHFWRTVLTLLAGLLYGVGWVVGKALGVLWLAGAWVVAAVKVGYREARAPRREAG